MAHKTQPNADQNTPTIGTPNVPASTPESKGVQPIVRLSLNIPEDTANAVKESARKNNQSATDAIRRSIAIMTLVDAELEAGRTIQSVDKDGTVTRFVFL